MWTPSRRRAPTSPAARRFGYTVVEPEAGPLAPASRASGRLADSPRDRRRGGRGGRRPAGPGARSGRAPAASIAEPPGRPTSRAGTSSSPPAARASRSTRSATSAIARTGKMGVAIAEAALERGARVTLIVGHVEVAAAAEAPTVVRAEIDGRDARRAVRLDRRRRPRRRRRPDHGRRRRRLPADARPPTRSSRAARASRSSSSRRRTSSPTSAVAAARRAGGTADPRPRPVLVGFAAETGSLDRAAEKLRRKGVDLLVANDVAEAAAASGRTRTGSRSWTPTAAARRCRCSTKREVADRILDRVATRVGRARRGGADCARCTREPEPRMSATDPGRPPPDRRRHPQAVRRRQADRRCSRRTTTRRRKLVDEAGIPLHPGRRFAGPGDARLRERDPGLDGRHAPPHQGRRPRREARARRRRHAVPVVLRRPRTRSTTRAASSPRPAPRP